jgi:hypothetical protein
MQAVSNSLLNTIEQDVSLGISSRVIAEWELNSYFNPVVTGSASIDEKMFPLESVELPRRPSRAGLPKLIVNQSRVTNQATYPRYRIPSEDANYKYYHSEAVSNGAGEMDVWLQVQYDDPVLMNKFVVGFETSFAAPTTVEIEYYDLGEGEWVTTGLWAPDSEGRIDLYLQDDETWGTQVTSGNYTSIDRWRVTVSEMSAPFVGVSVIQVSPRLSMDLSDRVIEVTVERTAQEHNVSNPIGSGAAATASILLSNNDRLFDDENQSSELYGLIDKNTRFDIFAVVKLLDGTTEAVSQGVFFADEWSVDPEGTVTVGCTDRSKFMQEKIIENSFYWNRPVERIIPDIVERFGHTDYLIQYAPEDLGRNIPYMFFKSENTVWDSLSNIATAEQASFYFDEQDRFVWQSRDFVWLNESPDYSLRSEVDGTSLPNIISFLPKFELTANKVNVKYTPYEPARSPFGEVINNVVWESSDTMALQSSPLQANLTTSSTQIRIPNSDHTFWPDEGFVNIGGEYIGFRKSNTTGRLNITQRGLFGSTPRSHNINPLSNFWSFYTAMYNNGVYSKINGNSSRGTHVIRNSRVELDAPSGQHYLTAPHFMGGSINDSYAMYGCEFIFPAGVRADGTPHYPRRGIGGMFIHGNGVSSGYYVEIMLTQYAITFQQRRAEVRVFRGTPNGRLWMPVAHSNPSDIYPSSGKQFDIVPGKRHRIEITYQNIDGVNNFGIWVDGSNLMNFADNRAGTKRSNGYWGVYCRDNTEMHFEAAWAIDRTGVDTDISSIVEQLRDRTNGGFVSGTVENAWRPYNRRSADVVFEDFGPFVQEGREFDVYHEIAPNVAADLFVSNDEDIHTLYHKRDAFRSKFAIVNKRRTPVIAVGQDPSRDERKMSLFVYGRPLVEQDESTEVAEDELSIRRRGPEELELRSSWVQTKSRARRIADWLVNRWGRPNDIVDVDMIIHPALQIGDLVTVSMPDENRLPETHRYNIISISRTFGAEHRMSVTLRRRR